MLYNYNTIGSLVLILSMRNYNSGGRYCHSERWLIFLGFEICYNFIPMQIVARQISIGQQPTLNCSSTDDESSAISRNNSDEILFTALALGLKCTVNQAFNFIAGGIGPASCPNLDRPAWLNEVWENNPQICPSDQSDFCTFLKMEC